MTVPSTAGSVGLGEAEPLIRDPTDLGTVSALQGTRDQLEVQPALVARVEGEEGAGVQHVAVVAAHVPPVGAASHTLMTGLRQMGQVHGGGVLIGPEVDVLILGDN